MPLNILLYDDSEEVRSSMEILLGSLSGLNLLAAMPNAETVETDIRQLKPDVVLMDIDMPEVNGVRAVGRIRAIDRLLPVIMLTVFDDNENILNAICAGASGYLLKSDAAREIGSAIRDVLNGGAPMTSSVAKKVLQMLPHSAGQNKEATNNLSEKETKILQLLVTGYSYKMIASEIKISIDTVRFHIRKIYDKLHVHSATEAVSKAIRQKLV